MAVSSWIGMRRRPRSRSLDTKQYAPRAISLSVTSHWPDRYFVPGEVRGYCTIGAPSRVGGDGAMVSGAGGL
jgi:hypothetical protein